jgi:hypothetical protein
MSETGSPRCGEPCGLQENRSRLSLQIDPTTTARKSAAQELFLIRVCELADRVTDGKIGFIDAVDMAHTSAVWSGLVDDIGDDAVQRLMAAAFGGIGQARKLEPPAPADSEGTST